LDLIGKVIEWLPRELKGNYVSAKTLEPLWQTFFETADTTPVALLYHDLFLDWLRRRALVTLTKPLESLPKDVLEHLFNQWLRPRLTLHSLSMTGFECFRTFFCALNSLRSTLRVSPSDSHEFEVVQYDLLGLDTLWHLVLVVQDTAADNSVFVETSKLLIDLHVRLASSLIPKSDQVVEAFLAKNMKYLQETVTTIRSIQERSQPNIFSASSCNNVSFASAPQEPTSTPSLKEVSFTHALDAHVRLVHRLVNLLNRFLQTWHEYYQKPRRSLLPSAQNENRSDALASSLQISFNNLQPKDREEWEKVAQVMDVVAVSELVAVIALRRTSWNSNEAISLLVDEESKHSILLEASKYEVATTTPQNSNAFSPRALLANKQEYFDLLFGLLTLKHIDNNLVWELVSSLPFNAQLETELRELRDVSQWEHLFDAFASPYRLLYTLRIINHFITPSAVTPMSQEELVAKNAWSKLFFRQGGFTKLYSLLQKISVTINDYLQHPAGKQTLVLLLHLLVYFMKGNIKELPFEKEDDNNVPTQNATASQNATTTQNSSTSSVSSTPTATQQRRKALILSTASQQRLSASLDFASFLTLILRLTSNILLLPHTYTEPDVEIVEHALVLVENSVAARTELLQTFYAFSEETYKTVDDLVLALLLYCSHAPIRACAAKHLRLLVMKFDAANIASTFPALRPPHLWLLRLLVDHIPDCNHPAAAHCHEFFELLNTLVSDMICPTETSQGFSASALSELNVDGIAVKLIERIKASPGEMSEQQEDRVLIGCMNVLATILRGKPTLRDTLCSSSATTDLLTEVYDHCLFVPMERIVEDESSTSKQIAESTSLCAVKCKSDAARRAAFALLSELVRDSASNSSELTSRLIAQNYIERRDKPIYYPLLEPQRKSSTGFVGLKNLGSTCYLNSLVQQLFMIPELRLGIFMAMPSLQSQKERSEAVLSMYELAKTFSWLQESERQYYDPTDFARSHKVPIGVPQDADEFFNLLCERIEDALKNTPQKNLLHSIFGGVLQQSVICGENSTHCSERNETFFRLSLHINDKSSLQQALDAFFQSEKLFDYQCEKCAKKVTATKSCVLIHLPNTLIIHLKRFDFDVSRMQRKKLTHRVTFPTSLNMYTYTAEARSERQKILSTVHKPRKDTHLMSSPQSNTARDTADTHDIATAMYELVGIIVHKGTAEAGHYYSFIKNRIRTTTTTITTTTTNNNNNSIWYRFDDTIVTPFDSSNLSDDYFEESDTVQLTLDEGMKVNSYILFYQRINCGSASEIVSSVTNPFSAHMLRDVIPQEFKKLIDIDNHLVLAERLRSGPLYLQFMHHTFVQYIKTHTDQFTCMSLEIDIADDVVAMKMIKIVATIVFDTLFRQSQRDWSLIQMWVALLRMLLEHHVPAARWFLARLVSWPFNSQWFEFALLECTESKIREIVADLIKYLLKVIIPFEYALFPSNYPNEERNRREGYEEYPGETVVYEMATKQFDSERILRQTAALPNQFHEITFAQLKGVAVSLRFVDYLIANLESTRPHWQHFQAYFSIWKELWYLGFPMRRYLINRGVIAQMVDYYMGSYSPYYESRHIQRTSLGDSSHMDFKEFVAALANAVCSCYTKVPPDDAAPPPLPPTACPDEPLLPWSCIDRAFLFNESFFDSLLKQGYNNSAVAKIVQHLAWENMALTVWIAQILFQAMWKCEVRQFHNTLNVLEELLNVHDSLQVWRIAVLLNYKNGGLLNVMAKMKNTSDFPALKIDEVLTFLPNLLQSNVLFAGYLFETRQAWAPIVENILLENMRMIQNDKSSKPLTNDKQAELKRYTELLTRYRTFWEGNSDIDCIWDSAFSLSNYPVQEIPGISNKLN
jgi:ubiquitin C-terminal hydrolase